MTADRARVGRAVADIGVYTVARLLLVIVITVLIYGLSWLLGVREFPVIVAVLLALIIAMPLGMWVFSPLRRRATASMALVGERRRRDREELRARLRGDTPPE